MSMIFLAASLLLLIVILRQLVLLSTTVQLLSKDAEVLQGRIKEEVTYLLIKGLY